FFYPCCVVVLCPQTLVVFPCHFGSPDSTVCDCHRKNSRVQISRAKLEDSGNYTCVAENLLGNSNSTSTVHVQSITTTPSSGSGHARRCNDSEKAYCVNGGDCYFIHGINQFSCK
uniref:Immunoglobulin I-set domain-containing protein n=1 Tax=Hucho hucho TaxID=62062 RepID=A0A4W5JQL9_9TELE